MVFADELVEALPVAQRLPGGIFDGFGERLLAADLDQPAVAVVVVGRPFEHVDGARPAHESAQPLSHMVPVDQEHDARPQMGEEAGEPGLVGSAEAAGRQQVLAGRQPVAAALLGTLPCHIERLERLLKNFSRAAWISV